MTEQEILQRAKMYMDKLAQGVDPITNQEVPGDSVLNNVRLARCFFYVSDVLGQVLANGGVVGSRPKRQPFSVTAEQLAQVQPSQEPVRITQLIDMISSAIGDPQMKKLRTTVITDWLLAKGFMVKQAAPDGKSLRIPTQNGLMLGMRIETRQGQYGEYQAVYYDRNAQQFVLDNLMAMLEEAPN